MEMGSFQHWGELFAMTNAILWAFVVILFKLTGDKKISPVSLNLFKISVGFVFLFITAITLHQPLFPQLDPNIYLLMAISGILGIGIADTLFFQCLNLLGASRSAIVECLYSPFIILFSFIFLNERLTVGNGIGAMLVISSLFFISGEKRIDPIPRKDLLHGAIAGAISMGTMGFGIVIIKPMLNDLPVVWVAMIRMFFGVGSLIIFSFFQPNLKKTWNIFIPQRIWKIALPACFLGSYGTMLLWVGSFKFASANVAGILTQLSVIFTVIFAYLFLKEPLTKKKVLSVILALFGSILVIS
ncbi:MAG: DMT family transporter [Proteobacteria bacterium]|jgi:drug/metabolite transporter (DMT)-like permease|nr:DMT family transporter [Pseudomonadota bacterium]